MHCDRYLMSLDKNPIATKAVTSAVLTLAGDLICQVHLQRLASRLMQCNAMRHGFRSESTITLCINLVMLMFIFPMLTDCMNPQ
jgi:hypothetical protein